MAWSLGDAPDIQNLDMWHAIYDRLSKLEGSRGHTASPGASVENVGDDCSDHAVYAYIQQRCQDLVGEGWYSSSDPFSSYGGAVSDPDGGVGVAAPSLPNPDITTVTDILGHDWTRRRPKEIPDTSTLTYYDGSTAVNGDIARNTGDGLKYTLVSGAWVVNPKPSPPNGAHQTGTVGVIGMNGQCAAGDYLYDDGTPSPHWIFDEIVGVLNALKTFAISTVNMYAPLNDGSTSGSGFSSEWDSAADAAGGLASVWTVGLSGAITGGAHYRSTASFGPPESWAADATNGEWFLTIGSGNGMSGGSFQTPGPIDWQSLGVTAQVVYYCFAKKSGAVVDADNTNTYDSNGVPLPDAEWTILETVSGTYSSGFRTATYGGTSIPDSATAATPTSGHDKQATNGYQVSQGPAIVKLSF